MSVTLAVLTLVLSGCVVSPIAPQLSPQEQDAGACDVPDGAIESVCAVIGPDGGELRL